MMIALGAAIEPLYVMLMLPSLIAVSGTFNPRQHEARCTGWKGKCTRAGLAFWHDRLMRSTTHTAVIEKDWRTAPTTRTTHPLLFSGYDGCRWCSSEVSDSAELWASTLCTSAQSITWPTGMRGGLSLSGQLMMACCEIYTHTVRSPPFLSSTRTVINCRLSPILATHYYFIISSLYHTTFKRFAHFPFTFLQLVSFHTHCLCLLYLTKVGECVWCTNTHTDDAKLLVLLASK